MIPIKIPKHEMKIRKKEKFLVNFANLKRLQTSAIPYMQRLLNKEDQQILNTKNGNTKH